MEINLTKAYIKNGKILMDGVNKMDTKIEQVLSVPFTVNEETQRFTITGSVEFLEDFVKLLTKSFK